MEKNPTPINNQKQREVWGKRGKRKCLYLSKSDLTALVHHIWFAGICSPQIRAVTVTLSGVAVSCLWQLMPASLKCCYEAKQFLIRMLFQKLITSEIQSSTLLPIPTHFCLLSSLLVLFFPCSPCAAWCTLTLVFIYVCACECNPVSSQQRTQHKWKVSDVLHVDFHDNLLSWSLKPWLHHPAPRMRDISNSFSNELSNMLSSSTDGLYTVGQSI